jgi:hypothetical protein
MSLRSRARALQRSMGISYQQALERIRSLGEAPAALARRTGWPLKKCDAHLLEPKAHPRPVTPLDPDQARAVTAVCEAVRAEAMARAVCVIDRDGAFRAMSGREALQLMALPRELRVGSQEPETLSLDPHGIHVLSCALDTGARLVVLFDNTELVGVVRLRARAAVRELNRILTQSLFFRPPGNGGSGSGAPEQISAFDGIFDRLGKIRSS